MIRSCPICETPHPHLTVHRDAVPVFQNVVYAAAKVAREATQAPFTLGTCCACGFSFNAVFDAKLVVYDESYDNHVESAAFDSYYRQIAAMLINRFSLTEGTVYDIGCGKGEFLRVLCELAPGIRGIGIDPSCTPTVEGNFELRRSVFSASVFDDEARLVLLRHVLEHIGGPSEFLGALRAAMPVVPLYVEVPDLDWILTHDAFWDFCYEHCNYFTAATLEFALRRAGLTVTDQSKSFGGQYQWALAVPGERVDAAPDPDRAITDLDAYLVRESAAVERLRARADSACGLALWGMATKGVLLATMLGAERVLGGIDMNIGKQGRFAAGTGIEIHGPNWLTTLSPNAAVIVMNPNYLSEIAATVETLRSDLIVEPI